MQPDSDEERIRRKAHQLWEADGRPHGKDEDHWVQAREIIAIEDSQGDTLLPRDTGAEEPIENADEALRNLADFPNLTDQGENLLTSTDREPSFGGAAQTMPSVEVPTTDQPGIPAKPRSNAGKPDQITKPLPKTVAPAAPRAPAGKAKGEPPPSKPPSAKPAPKKS